MGASPAHAERGIELYVERTAEAKVALAVISRYLPETREWSTRGWELEEANASSMTSTIELRRAAALHTERLFRQPPRLNE